MVNLQEWEQIKEEFGDDAFKRLKPKWPLKAGCNDNQDIQIGLNSGLSFVLKSLPELFEMDVQTYGDNAYLMWECAGVGWVNCNSNDDVLNPDFHCRRKTSAAR